MKANQGLIFSALVTIGVDSSNNAAAPAAAERFVHHFYGVNALQLVMLTDMGSADAEQFVYFAADDHVERPCKPERFNG